MKKGLFVLVLGILTAVLLFAFLQIREQKKDVQTIKKESTVPLPQEEDVIRLFFDLIDEGRVAEAVLMMGPRAIEDESNKQAWGVQWNAFEEIKVISVENERDSLFKVELEIKMKPGADKISPMPYYGFGDGRFTRWVELESVDGVWKINGLATGP